MPDEPKTASEAADAWKERRAEIVQRGADARKRVGASGSLKADSRVTEQRELNARREASQEQPPATPLKGDKPRG